MDDIVYDITIEERERERETVFVWSMKIIINHLKKLILIKIKTRFSKIKTR